MKSDESDHVRLHVHLASPPERVFEFLSTDSGRGAFWAETAEERDGIVRFRFTNGMTHDGKILESQPHRLFSVEYFGGSNARFELSPDGSGGTDVTLVETCVPQAWLTEHRAGWVSVLLALKAAVDFEIDLRNRDPDRSWENGYVDV